MTSILTPATGTSSLLGKEQQFQLACKAARVDLGEALDLVLIHNERDVRGTQPRSSLNPVTVLLAVAAWERLIADVDHLASSKLWAGPGAGRSPHRAARLDVAARVLGAASGGLLPDGWRVRAHENWRGKTPTRPVVLAGTDPQLSDLVDDYVDLRHAVAHRAYLQKGYQGSYWHSDADGHTVQAGAARAALALFIQLVDQSIAAIGTALAQAGAPVDPQTLALPAWWFDTHPPAGARGIDAPGQLWGSADLLRWTDDT